MSSVPPKMRYCKKCVYPFVGVNLVFDDEMVCSACQVAEEIDEIPESFWKQREELFLEILTDGRKRSRGGYDCIIPVGGGKDSWWQTHVVKKYGFNPLLVTYHGNNYLPEGQENLDAMRRVFDVDHIVVGPGVGTLRKLNRAAFRKMGDMNWHAHAGIRIVPMIAAIKLEIPVVVWGEIAWDIAGMFSPDDYVEYNKRTVFEHDMRGFTLEDFVGEEGLEEQDMHWLKMPSDEEFARVGVKGIFVGNFFRLDPNLQTKIMVEELGFQTARAPFERTYRRMSNLDDMHENGAHDYLKFVKFGYGRASDHASKDIRLGVMTREQGIEMVRQYDHVKPMKDLSRWLKYTGMTEAEFDEIADGFRDPRVWWRDESGEWRKWNIWDE
ncbi:MAG: N-acetyl sugar amidotransferase [Bdellovibrionales bacterium]|nr:N-acetyl sugar amidotransferase [Bdellovibrionales bacterium]